jgi:hypothetical protein
MAKSPKTAWNSTAPVSNKSFVEDGSEKTTLTTQPPSTPPLPTTTPTAPATTTDSKATVVADEVQDDAADKDSKKKGRPELAWHVQA